MYSYAASLLKVIDGDTIDVEVDLGFDIQQQMRIRFAHINAPEKSTPEGMVSKNRVTELMPVGTVFRLDTLKDKKEKFGRYLGIIFLSGATGSLNDQLVAEGLAVPFM